MSRKPGSASCSSSSRETGWVRTDTDTDTDSYQVGVGDAIFSIEAPCMQREANQE